MWTSPATLQLATRTVGPRQAALNQRAVNGEAGSWSRIPFVASAYRHDRRAEFAAANQARAST